MSGHGDNLEDSSPTGVTAFCGVAEGASNSVAMEQWDTAQACAALDALKQWHEEVAQQFRKYKVDEEKLKSMADSDAVARELRVPRAAVAAIAEYIKPLVATARLVTCDGRCTSRPVSVLL